MPRQISAGAVRNGCATHCSHTASSMQSYTYYGRRTTALYCTLLTMAGGRRPRALAGRARGWLRVRIAASRGLNAGHALFPMSAEAEARYGARVVRGAGGVCGQKLTPCRKKEDEYIAEIIRWIPPPDLIPPGYPPRRRQRPPKQPHNRKRSASASVSSTAPEPESPTGKEYDWSLTKLDGQHSP